MACCAVGGGSPKRKHSEVEGPSSPPKRLCSSPERGRSDAFPLRSAALEAGGEAPQLFTLRVIPKEMLEGILLFVDPRDQDSSCKKVCREWHELCMQGWIWKEKVVGRWTVGAVNFWHGCCGGDWRQQFIHMHVYLDIWMRDDLMAGDALESVPVSTVESWLLLPPEIEQAAHKLRDSLDWAHYLRLVVQHRPDIFPAAPEELIERVAQSPVVEKSSILSNTFRTQLWFGVACLLPKFRAVARSGSKPQLTQLEHPLKIIANVLSPLVLKRALCCFILLDHMFRNTILGAGRRSLLEYVNTTLSNPSSLPQNGAV